VNKEADEDEEKMPQSNECSRRKELARVSLQ
jgi:hypothetical protein